MELATATRRIYGLRRDLEIHLDVAKRHEAELREQIRQCAAVLASSADGIDYDKVELAKTVIYVHGSYARAGEDRASVIADAMKQIATGEPVRKVYGDLWLRYFGTKNYDRWSGQRSDHPYFMGPGHGSIVFEVGLVEKVRKERQWADLSAAEIEAAIYYLVNLERVQAAEQKAREQAAA
ncbi:hypothetical protein G6M02_07940 [Agrobacterium rhizogenes]|nr:hypothetical protein [Rhizobium rhizogenes]